MELKPSSAPAEANRSSLVKRAIGLAALSLPLIACRFSDVVTSGDPTFSFIRGAAGTVLLEAELGMGKLLGYGLNKAQSVPLGCLSIAACAVPPLLIGAASIEYPIVGYVALGLPIVSALAWAGHRD